MCQKTCHIVKQQSRQKKHEVLLNAPVKTREMWGIVKHISQNKRSVCHCICSSHGLQVRPHQHLKEVTQHQAMAQGASHSQGVSDSFVLLSCRVWCMPPSLSLLLLLPPPHSGGWFRARWDFCVCSHFPAHTWVHIQCSPPHCLLTFQTAVGFSQELIWIYLCLDRVVFSQGFPVLAG